MPTEIHRIRPTRLNLDIDVKVKAMLTIEELTQTVSHGMTPRMVRHYHQIGLLPSHGNYRLYGDTDVQQLKRIAALKQQ